MRSVPIPGNRVYLWLLLVLLIPVAAAAVDVSGTYTGAARDNSGGVTSLGLTLAQQGTSVTGTLQVPDSQCFSSLSFTGTLSGTTLSGAFTDSTSRIAVKLTAIGNTLSGPYTISKGPCAGEKFSNGTVTFTRTAGAPTPTPTATPTPTPPPSCAGDCNGLGQVTVSDLITLARIVLGEAGASACPAGIPSGGQADVVMITQGVNNALKGCPP